MSVTKNSLVVLIGLGLAGALPAQIKIAKERIPPDMSSNVRAQVERLYSGSPEERARGTEALGELGDKAASAVPFLVLILDDQADVLVQGAFLSAAIVAEVASRALGKIGSPAVEPLIAVLEDKTASDLVRGRAAEALGATKDSRAVAPLLAALKDPDAFVRSRAAGALGGTRDARAVVPLSALLRDKDRDVRWRSVIALAEIKDARAVQPLITVLGDEDEQVRLRAAEGLGELGDKRAVEPLIGALQDQLPVVKKYAEEALKKITGQNLGGDQSKWREWWEQYKAANR